MLPTESRRLNIGTSKFGRYSTGETRCRPSTASDCGSLASTARSCTPIEVVGCSLKGLRKLYTLATRHLRVILKPAHISHVTNVTIWATAGQHTPEQHILHRMQRLYEQRDPALSITGSDIVSNDEVTQQLASLMARHQAHQSRLEDDRTAPKAAGSDLELTVGIACPHCDRELPTSHALRIHIGLQHKDQRPAGLGSKVSFSAPQHAVDGTPTCRVCRRSFTKCGGNSSCTLSDARAPIWAALQQPIISRMPLSKVKRTRLSLCSRSSMTVSTTGKLSSHAVRPRLSCPAGVFSEACISQHQST